MPDTSQTYIMKNPYGLLKIGRSSDVEQRRKTMEAHSGLKITVEHSVEGSYLEAIVHGKLSEYRTIGEWFECDLDVAIKALNDAKSEYIGNTLGLTLEELIKVQKEELDHLLEEVGGVGHLSKMLHLHYTTVKGWEIRGRISKKGAIMVEEHKTLREHYKAKDLRPDL